MTSFDERNQRVRGGLYFGIPSLDDLIGTADSSSETTSVTILGPDGTGKSVLAMHLAATYVASAARSGTDHATKVIYVSTDLKHEKAVRVWTNFGLQDPLNRDIPFEPDDHRAWRDSLKSKSSRLDVILQHVVPGETARKPVMSMADFLSKGRSDVPWEVGFLDLASYSAGDDWGFLNRILAHLQKGQGDFRHLMVIDSVAGFETLVGKVDAYGERTTRRARIAQIMRAAAEDCHIVFVVEESREHEHLPEEYVTDVVIRLRRTMVRGSTRRTIEIEKARARSHALGEHPFEIRERIDAPDAPADEPKTSVAHVQVFPGLHYRYRSVREPEPVQRDRYSGFGIKYLDNMLGSTQQDEDKLGRIYDVDKNGLPAGTLTALIGDAGTRKTPLGYAFLSECYREYLTFAARLLTLWGTGGTEAFYALFEDFSKQRIPPWTAKAPSKEEELARAIADMLDGPPFARPAVLITTQHATPQQLADKFCDWLWRPPNKGDKGTKDRLEKLLKQAVQKYIICRRIGVQDQPTPVLFHLIERNIIAARKLLGNVEASQIRVVIDDFQTIRETYPDVREDPLFLPFLAHYLRNEGVSALIIDTDSGRPDTEPSDKLDAELRALVNSHIYTWRVPFYGEQRVAIAVVPPLSHDHIGVVRELEVDVSSPQKPNVVPHFELYAGLEEGRPRRVPLEIRLYDETTAFEEYVKQENALFGKLFVAREADGEVIKCERIHQYDGIRDYCNIPTKVRLDHTLLFQVDGFWALGDRQALQNQHAYLNDLTDDPHADPLKLFQPTGHYQLEQPKSRLDYFDNTLYKTRISTTDKPIDRVPFMWDFGFLLCASEPWKRAEKNLLPKFRISGREVRVGDVWRALPKITESGSIKAEAGDEAELSSWRAFLEACKVVAEVESLRTSRPTRVFDVAVQSPDSISCLVLEIWASEIQRSIAKAENHPGREFWESLDLSARYFTPVKTPNGQFGLADLLREQRDLAEIYRDESGVRPEGLAQLHRFSLELYKTWLLLVDVLDMASYLRPDNPFVFQVEHPPDESAVAARHWYKTACMTKQQQAVGSNDLAGPFERVPVRLPGHFSVRGDWYLAAAHGSRSSRLAHRALDLMSSRRANLIRMQLGLGLPVRDVMPEQTMRVLRTRLTVRDPDVGISRGIEYGELDALTASEPGFSWLWRSGLGNYDRQSRNWQKWLARAFLESHRFRYSHREDWVRGFDIYDQIEQGNWAELAKLDSLKIFGDKCAQLIVELEQASYPRK